MKETFFGFVKGYSKCSVRKTPAPLKNVWLRLQSPDHNRHYSLLQTFFICGADKMLIAVIGLMLKVESTVLAVGRAWAAKRCE